MICGIYCIQQKSTGLKYYGQSINIPARWAEHMSQAEECLSDDYFHYALKLNPTDFDFTIVELCEREELNSREDYYITKFDTVEHGFNSRKAPCTVHKKENKQPPTVKQIKVKLESIVGKPLFVEDKQELSNFFQKRDRYNRLLKWNTIKKTLIKQGYEIQETKRSVNGKQKNCSIIRLSWEE